MHCKAVVIAVHCTTLVLQPQSTVHGLEHSPVPSHLPTQPTKTHTSSKLCQAKHTTAHHMPALQVQCQQSLRASPVWPAASCCAENAGLAAAIAAIYQAKLYANSASVGLWDASFSDVLALASLLGMARCDGPHVSAAD